MTRYSGYLALVLVAIVSVSCSSVKPGAGEEAVLIMQPWIFGHGGVDPTPIKTGQVWTAVTTDHALVDMKPQQFKIHFEDFMTKDGVPLDFDAVIRLRVIDSVKMIQGFGPQWYSQNVEAEVVNRARNAVRKHGLNETAIETTALDAIDQEVSEGILSYIKEAGLPAEMIQFTIGKANPPDAVKNQRIETASQQQRALTEKEREQAEIHRKAAETARAAADNAYRESMSMDQAQFIQLEQINMLKQVCLHHPDGTGGGCTFLVGQTGVSPVLPVGK